MLSVVSAPKKNEGRSLDGAQALPDSDEDDDLEIFERGGTGGETLEGHGLIDLDESGDDELVVGLPETS